MEKQNFELRSHTEDITNPHKVTKAQVGLDKVLNMEQATKLEFDDHVKNLSNPNSVTKDQIGLGNVNIEQASKTNFNNHATDKTIHVTVNDRNKWNTAEANSKACTDVHAADTVNYQKLPQIMAVCQLPLMKERTYFKK